MKEIRVQGINADGGFAVTAMKMLVDSQTPRNTFNIITNCLRCRTSRGVIEPAYWLWDDGTPILWDDGTSINL